MTPLLVQSIAKKCSLTLALYGFNYPAIFHEFTFHVCNYGTFIIGVPTFRDQPVFRISGRFTIRV